MLRKQLNLLETARKLLIIGGLIGLIFSKAEGISLLPFPQDEVVASTDASINFVGANDGKCSYSQTVKRTNSVKSYKGKSKSFEPFANITVSISDAKPSASLQSATRVYSRQIIDLSRHLSGSTVTRGPPSVI